MAEEKIPLSPKGKEPLESPKSPLERREEAKSLEARIRKHGARRFIGHKESEELSSRILNAISPQQEKQLLVPDSYITNLEALRFLWHCYPSTDHFICETMDQIFRELPPPYLLEDSDRVECAKQKAQEISQYIEALSPWPMFRMARKYLQELQVAWVSAKDNYSRRASASIPMGEKYYHMDVDDARKILSVTPYGKRSIKEISTGQSSVCELGGVHFKSGRIPEVDGEVAIAEEDSSTQFRREAQVSTLLQFLAGSPFVVAPVCTIKIQGVPIISSPRDGSQPAPITIDGLVQASLSIKGMDLKNFLELRGTLETWQKILPQDFEKIMKDAKTDFEEILKATKSKFPHIFQEKFDKSQSEALREVIENLSEENSVDQAKDIQKIKKRDEGARKNAFYGAYHDYFKKRGGTIEDVYILIGLMYQFPSLMKGRNVMGRFLDPLDRGLSMSLLSEVHNIRTLFKPLFIDITPDGTQNRRSLFELLSTDSVLEACQKIANLLMELDEESSVALALVSILALLGDGKGDNFILNIFMHEGKLKWRLVAIDTEKSLRMPVKSEDLSLQDNKYCLTIKNILFLLPEIMGKPLHPEVRKRILSFSAEHEVLRWLCFSAGLGSEKIELPGQVIYFLRDNLEKLQDIVREDADITLDECLRKLDPVVWTAYRALPILTRYELFSQELNEKHDSHRQKLMMQLKMIKNACQDDPELQEVEESKIMEEGHQQRILETQHELLAQTEWLQLQQQLEQELLETKKELKALQLLKKNQQLTDPKFQKLQTIKVKHGKIEHQLYAWQWLEAKVVASTKQKLPAQHKLQIYWELWRNYPSAATLEDSLYQCGEQYDLSDLIGGEELLKLQEDGLSLFHHVVQKCKKKHEMPITAQIYCLAQLRGNIRWTVLPATEIWEYVEIFCLLPPKLNTVQAWEEAFGLGKGDVKREEMKFRFQSWLVMAIIKASPLVAQTMIYYFGADINFLNLEIQKIALHELCIHCKNYPDFETAELMATILFTDPRCQPYRYSEEGSLLLTLMTHAGEFNDLNETQTEIVLYVFDALVKGGANLEARNVRNETLVDEFLKKLINYLETPKSFSEKKSELLKKTWFVTLVNRGAGIHADENIIYEYYQRYSKLGIMIEGFEEAINMLKKRNLGLSERFVLKELETESSQVEGVKLGLLHFPPDIQRRMLKGSSSILDFKINSEDECNWQLTDITEEEVKRKEVYYIFYRLIAGKVTAPNDFLIVRKEDDSSSIIEISQTISGKTLLEFLKEASTMYSSPRNSRAFSISKSNHPFSVSPDSLFLPLRFRDTLTLNLNEKELSALFIMIMTLDLNVGPEVCKLVSVDAANKELGDRIILTNISKQPGCILFYFKEMLKSVHYSVREQMLFQSSGSIGQECVVIFKDFIKKFGLLLDRETASELPEFIAFKTIQEKIRENPNISHIELLKTVKPSWGEHYYTALKFISPWLATGTKPWGFQRGEAQLSPLVALRGFIPRWAKLKLIHNLA